jgi:hypothetical protein
MFRGLLVQRWREAEFWWTHKGSNLGPLLCEGNALPLSRLSAPTGMLQDAFRLTTLRKVSSILDCQPSHAGGVPITRGGNDGRGDALYDGRYDGDEPDGAHSIPAGPTGYRLVLKKTKRRERSQRMQFSGT